MKKILALLMALVMVFALAACGESKPEETKGPSTEAITLKVWTPAEDQSKDNNWLQKELDAFAAAHPEYKITWELGVCPEGDVGKTVTADTTKAADVYMYANDQIGTLVQAGALAKLGGAYEEQVKKDNTQVVVDTVTNSDGGLYGFPVTNNCWYLFYNKSIFTEEDVKSLDAMLAKGKVAFDIGNGWYNSAFFFANGCTMFGPIGNDASKGIDFGGQKGYDAAAATIAFVNDPNFVNAAGGSAGLEGLKDGSVGAHFTGTWDYAGLEKVLGENLGVAQPPMVTIAGKQVQMMSFRGTKAVGVNPNCKNQKAAMQLASFLASKEAQMDRFNMRNVIPTHVELATSEAVLKNPCAAVEMATMEKCSVVQPVITEMAAYWTPAGTFGAAIANKEVTMENYQDQVDRYNDQLNSSGL